MPWSIYPALSHFLSMAFSIGIWVKSHACEMASKQLVMSPSSIRCGESLLASMVKHCSIASAVERPGRKPYELGVRRGFGHWVQSKQVESLHGSALHDGNT